MKKIKKSILLLLVFLFIFQLSASAKSPYQSYVYDPRGFANTAPDPFIYDKIIRLQDIENEEGKSIGDLNEPTDIFVSKDEKIYIADTGNQRVVVLNKDFTFFRIISDFVNDKTDLNGDGTIDVFTDRLNDPTCTFIDERDNSIYICDMSGAIEENTDKKINTDLEKETGRDIISEGNSGRIIHLDEDGKLIRVIYGVTSDVLPNNYYFRPMKVVVDKAGRIFVISYLLNMGLMELTTEGEFVQMLGAPTVAYNIFQLVERFFSTKAMKERMEAFVATEYNNINIDDQGFVYVTNSIFDMSTYSSVDVVSKLNAKGKNVLKKPTFKPYGDTEAGRLGTFKGPSRIIDIKTFDNGTYAILDELRGRVFVYNDEGINLFVFGTKPDISDPDHTTYIKGTMDQPVSMEWIGDSCLILDSESKSITVYKMTEYANLIREATYLNALNQFDKEEELWEKVFKLNNNSAAAKSSMGMVAYRNGEWKVAMNYFKEIFDTDNYSKAYKYQRQDYIGQYFNLGALILLILIALFIIIKKLFKKYVPPVKENSFLDRLKYSKMILFRPIHSYWFLIRENRATMGSATTIMLVAAFISMLQARFTGFIFSPNAEYVNVPLEFMKIILPVLLFCVCNWSVTSLMNGEGNFRAIYISAGYALTPIIVLYPFSILLSNIMVKEEGDLYAVFITIALVWVLGLIFIGNMRIHDFSLGTTIVEMVITIIVMILVIFLGILFFALIQQMWDFATDIIEEISMRR